MFFSAKTQTSFNTHDAGTANNESGTSAHKRKRHTIRRLVIRGIPA
jgi:hypothetical protein